MKLVVGLGNPGAEYERTRHNAGWFVIDALARAHASTGIAQSKFHAAVLDASLAGEKVLLVKPTTYMNRSGQSVGEAVRFFKLEPETDLIVVVDEVDLPVGHVRVRATSRGGGSHNGLADIDRALGGADYIRVRFGVGRTPRQMSRADWVLSRFMAEEKDDVERGVKDAAQAVECCIAEGVQTAMNRFNKKITGSDAGERANDPNEMRRRLKSDDEERQAEAS